MISDGDGVESQLPIRSPCSQCSSPKTSTWLHEGDDVRFEVVGLTVGLMVRTSSMLGTTAVDPHTTDPTAHPAAHTTACPHRPPATIPTESQSTNPNTNPTACSATNHTTRCWRQQKSFRSNRSKPQCGWLGPAVAGGSEDGVVVGVGVGDGAGVGTGVKSGLRCARG